MEVQATLHQDPQPAQVVWTNDGAPEIRVPFRVLEALTDYVMRGFQFYPWGGVEVGGILFGVQDAEYTSIVEFVPVECSHENGPSFDLTAADQERFAETLRNSLTGLIPVGWFHSLSRKELALSQQAESLHKKYFPEKRQIAMVLRRTKGQAPEIGFFARSAIGEMTLHSPVRTWEKPAQEPPKPQLVESPKPAVEPIPEREETAKELPSGDNLPLAPVIAPTEKQVATEPGAEPRVPLVSAPASTRPEIIVPPKRTADVHRMGPFTALGLERDPFAQNLDQRFFCAFEQHGKALKAIRHRLDSGSGFVALLAEEGLGKSLLLEELMQQFESDFVPFAHLSNPSLTVPEFYEMLAHGFDLPLATPSKVAVMIALEEHQGARPTLIVDNAEQLSTALLQELHLLGNTESRGGRVLQIVLAATPVFEQRLSEDAELRGLRQRLLHRVRLERMTSQETHDYISRRLAVAGLENQAIFPPFVIAEVHEHARGIPRLTNLICGALLERCLEQPQGTATLSMLLDVVHDLDLTSL